MKMSTEKTFQLNNINYYNRIVEKLFEKKFELPPFEQQWSQLDPALCFTSDLWDDEQMLELKNVLNACKNKLNNCNLEEWCLHTKKRNPAGEVNWRLQQVIHPEFLTQAWTKFYECAFEYNIIPEQAVRDKKLVSLHLCEAPGAFISSLNHYLALKHSGIEWEWKASTLNPYYEGNSPSQMIADDRFMFHTLDHWDFGEDYTGNLMDWDNSQTIISNTRNLGKVLLVTADGSVDCVETPDEQESVTSALHYCEIVTALQVLDEGGTFVFKLFTFFEHCTINLLYLVNYLFKKVHLFKPATSKLGNSEVYVICLKFKGSSSVKPLLPRLREAYGRDLYRQSALFPRQSISPQFLYCLRESAEKLSQFQSEVIEDNLRAFTSRAHENYLNIKLQRENTSKKFITHYKLRAIKPEQTILNETANKHDKMNQYMKKRHKGSFNSRLSYKKKGPQNKLKELMLEFNNDIIPLNHALLHENKTVEVYSAALIPLTVTCGHPVQSLCSSQFIYLPIFKLYQKIIAIEEFRNIVLRDNSDRDVRAEVCGDHCTLTFPDYHLQEGYDVFEKQCCQQLINIVNQMQFDNNLILINFNLLTLFNVSIINILCRNSFKSVTFEKDGRVILNSFCKPCAAIDFDHLNENRTYLNMLPIKIIIGDYLYNTIVSYNNEVYKNKSYSYLETINNEFNEINICHG